MHRAVENAAVLALGSPIAAAGRAGIVCGMDTLDDDTALMLRYARGELSAFTQLYERHKGSLYRYLLHQACDRAIADDLFQEVWSRIVASRARYRPLAKFSTFLFSIGRNCFIDHCRRAANSPLSHSASLDAEDFALADSSHRAPDRQTESAQTAVRFRRALAALPQEQREVFVLHEESGLSLDEIARLTGVGMETAKSRLRYALAKLRQSLGEHHGADRAASR